jgi:hypothetical protein
MMSVMNFLVSSLWKKENEEWVTLILWGCDSVIECVRGPNAVGFDGVRVANSNIRSAVSKQNKIQSKKTIQRSENNNKTAQGVVDTMKM